MKLRKLCLESRDVQVGYLRGDKDRILEISITPKWEEVLAAVVLLFR